MLPLVFLEKQILSCPDPVSMLSRFGSKAWQLHVDTWMGSLHPQRFAL